MSSEDDPIDALTDSMSINTPIDWEEAARDVPAEHQSRVKALQDIESIGSFNRALQRHGRDLRAVQDSAPLPDQWGDLIPLERLSSNENSELLRAWDPDRGTDVLLELWNSSAEISDERFAQARALVGRPAPRALVAPLGAARHDGRVGIWTQLQSGPTLRHHLDKHGKLTPDEGRRLGVDVGSALTSLHEAGVEHGNVRPTQVFLDGEGGFCLGGLSLLRGEALGNDVTPRRFAPDRDILDLINLLRSVSDSQAEIVDESFRASTASEVVQALKAAGKRTEGAKAPTLFRRLRTRLRRGQSSGD